MEHVWTVLCQRHLTDKTTNQVSLIDVVEEIRVVENGLVRFRPIPFDAWFVSFWARSDTKKPEKGEMRVSLTGPSGEVLLPPEKGHGEVDLTEKLRRRTAVHMVSVPSPESGSYHFIVEQRMKDRWRQVARIPFDVMLVEEQASSDAPSQTS